MHVDRWIEPSKGFAWISRSELPPIRVKSLNHISIRQISIQRPSSSPQSLTRISPQKHKSHSPRTHLSTPSSSATTPPSSSSSTTPPSSSSSTTLSLDLCFNSHTTLRPFPASLTTQRLPFELHLHPRRPPQPSTMLLRSSLPLDVQPHDAATRRREPPITSTPLPQGTSDVTPPSRVILPLCELYAPQCVGADAQLYLSAVLACLSIFECVGADAQLYLAVLSLSKSSGLMVRGFEGMISTTAGSIGVWGLFV